MTDCEDCIHVVFWTDEFGEHYGCGYRKDMIDGCPDYEVRDEETE